MNKGKHSKELDRAIFLTLVVISIAVIVAVLFSNASLGEYSRKQIIALEGIDVPTLSAVVGERRVIAVEEDTIADARSSKELQYALDNEGSVTSENLTSYVQFLIDNEMFIPIVLNEEASDFTLAKRIGGGRVFQVRTHYTTGELVSIDYAVAVDAEKYDILTRFEKMNDLFAEHELDTAPLLTMAGGLTEQFWGLALSEAMEGTGSGDFLSRFLEIATDE